MTSHFEYVNFMGHDDKRLNKIKYSFTYITDRHTDTNTSH